MRDLSDPAAGPAAVRMRWPFAVAGVLSLVLLAPMIGDVYMSLGRAAQANGFWILVAVSCVFLGFASSWTLQRATLRAERWGDVVAPHLAGNAASNVLPAGSALGSVIQLRMLRHNGFDFTRSATALALSGMLSSVASLFVFPLLILLPIGDTVDGLDTAARFGVIALAVGLVVVAIVLRGERPMRWFASAVHGILRHAPWCRPPDDLPERIVRERDGIRDVLRARKAMTVSTSLGRVLGDYLALYASMLAVGLHPSPAIVLVAFITANAAGMVPLTPGGLGFVEAGLTGAIALAGAADQQALAAVAIYRLASCWIPVAAGMCAYAWSRRRAAVPLEVVVATPELQVA